MSISSADQIQIVGWSIGAGFVIILLVIIAVWCEYDMQRHKDKTISINPFAPFIRCTEAWLRHRMEMQRLQLELKMKRFDPDYTAYLEQKDNGEKHA